MEPSEPPLDPLLQLHTSSQTVSYNLSFCTANAGKLGGAWE